MKEKKKRYIPYIFLFACVILLSVSLPKLIDFVTGQIVEHIQSPETENSEETDHEEEEIREGTTTIGDPSLYEEDPLKEDDMELTEEEILQQAKYDLLVEAYQSYIGAFTHENIASDSLEKGKMEAFLKHNPEQFVEAAATYAYGVWGTERTIRQIRFDSVTSYTDANGDEVEQAMLEFLHTSHPETEEGTQVICIYYVNQDYYYFP